MKYACLLVALSVGNSRRPPPSWVFYTHRNSIRRFDAGMPHFYATFANNHNKTASCLSDLCKLVVQCTFSQNVHWTSVCSSLCCVRSLLMNVKAKMKGRYYQVISPFFQFKLTVMPNVYFYCNKKKQRWTSHVLAHVVIIGEGINRSLLILNYTN